MLASAEQQRVLNLLKTITPPRSGAGKVSVTFVLNFAPGGLLHRLQYHVGEEGDVPK